MHFLYCTSLIGTVSAPINAFHALRPRGRDRRRGGTPTKSRPSRRERERQPMLHVPRPLREIRRPPSNYREALDNRSSHGRSAGGWPRCWLRWRVLAAIKRPPARKRKPEIRGETPRTSIFQTRNEIIVIIYDSRFHTDSSPKIRVSETVPIACSNFGKGTLIDENRSELKMTSATTKVVLPSGISYASLAWEKSLATPWCGVSNSFVGDQRACRRGIAAGPYLARRLFRAVGMLAVRGTAARPHACSRIIAGTACRWILPLPRLFLSRSDVRFDRFHGWSALVHYVPPSGTERFATHCHFSALGRESV